MQHIIRFPGITRHARALGVSRNHLFLVLSGERRSDSLSARYEELCKEENRVKSSARRGLAKRRLVPELTTEEWRELAGKITPTMRAEAAKHIFQRYKVGQRYKADRTFFEAFVEEQIRPYCRRDGAEWVCERPFAFGHTFSALHGGAIFVVVPKLEEEPAAEDGGKAGA